MQGFELERAALEDLIDVLASKPASKRGDVSGIKPDRGDVILGGALVVAAALDSGGFDGIEVTEAGMREGVFFERLLGGPALFEDVRSESVENLAHRFNGDTDHVDRVARLSLEMFDGLGSAGLHDHGAAERELLWAACMLHDIGTAIDYEDHHHHSNYLILNTGLPGFSARELMLVGLVTRYHRKGDPDVSQLRDLALKGDDELLRLLSGIIRLSEQFERSRDGTIRRVSVAPRNGAVVLGTEIDPARDPSVPIWAARRNADLLRGRSVARSRSPDAALVDPGRLIARAVHADARLDRDRPGAARDPPGPGCVELRHPVGSEHLPARPGGARR